MAKSGKFEEQVPDEDILDHFESGDRPFYKSNEIADALDLSREQAHRRLEQLFKRDEIQKIKAGEQSVIWWRQRDSVVLSRSECDEYAVMDTTTGIASQGETRAEALRMLANALELAEEAAEDPTVDAETPNTPWFED